MVRDIDRRDVLKSVGGAGVVGLAGCITQDGNGSGNGGGNGGNGGGNGGNGNGNGGGEDTPDGSDDTSRTLSHGVLLPETGDLASLGSTIRDGAILPAAVLEGGDHPFEIDIQQEDTQTDPQAGVQAASAIASAGVPSVTGAASSAVSLQVYQQTFIPNGIVGCSPASTSPAITGLDDDNLIFRTCPSDALQGPVMAQVAAEQRDLSSASVMYLNNDYGQALKDSFVGAFQDDHGGSVPAEVAFEPEQSSYSSPLSDAMGDDPEVLVIIAYPASGIQIFRDFYADYGTDTDILVTDGLRDSTLPDEVGNDMANVYGTSPLAQGPGTDVFNQQYEDEYDRAPSVFNAQAYDATAVCLLANAAAGENDGDAIKEQMQAVANPNDGTEITPDNLAEGLRLAAEGEAIYYQGASSSVDFDDNGDMTAVTYEYFQFNTDVEGNIEQLDTIDFEA